MHKNRMPAPMGFGYDMDGFASGFGDNARVYTSYGGDEWMDDEIGIGQNPGKW